MPTTAAAWAGTEKTRLKNYFWKKAARLRESPACISEKGEIGKMYHRDGSKTPKKKTPVEGHNLQGSSEKKNGKGKIGKGGDI